MHTIPNCTVNIVGNQCDEVVHIFGNLRSFLTGPSQQSYEQGGSSKLGPGDSSSGVGSSGSGG